MDAQVVDIYGMAEFDAVGIELEDSIGLTLVNEYEYGLCTNGLSRPLIAGDVGELTLRIPGTDTWHVTGDLVTVIKTTTDRSGFLAQILIEGRKDLVVQFSDGSAISEAQVSALADQLSDIDIFQIQVHSTELGDVIKAMCVPRKWPPQIDPKEIIDRIVNINVDVADSIQHGVIVDCSLDILPDDSSLFQTLRGKRPILVRVT